MLGSFGSASTYGAPPSGSPAHRNTDGCATAVEAAASRQASRRRQRRVNAFGNYNLQEMPTRSRSKVALPEDAEDFRDYHWRREETRRVETAAQAEEFIERVGFAACLTDSR